MTLDRLYEIAKSAHYPIKSREELMGFLKDTIIEFEGKKFDAQEIAVHIREYPIHKPSDLIRFFLVEEDESYTNQEAADLGDFEARLEKYA